MSKHGIRMRPSPAALKKAREIVAAADAEKLAAAEGVRADPGVSPAPMSGGGGGDDGDAVGDGVGDGCSESGGAGEAGGSGSDDGSAPPSPKPAVKAGMRYDPVLARKICRLISNGHTMKGICRRPDMPHNATVFSWICEHEDFRKKYLIARQVARDGLDDEILEIIDDKSEDIVSLKDKEGLSRQVLNPVAVQRAKARVAARHVMIGRHTTRKYANEFDADGNPIGAAKPTPPAPPANVLTEERRQKLIERRRAAIEANLRAEGKLPPPPPLRPN